MKKTMIINIIILVLGGFGLLITRFSNIDIYNTIVNIEIINSIVLFLAMTKESGKEV